MMVSRSPESAARRIRSTQWVFRAVRRRGAVDTSRRRRRARVTPLAATLIVIAGSAAAAGLASYAETHGGVPLISAAAPAPSPADEPAAGGSVDLVPTTTTTARDVSIRLGGVDPADSAGSAVISMDGRSGGAPTAVPSPPVSGPPAPAGTAAGGIAPLYGLSPAWALAPAPGVTGLLPPTGPLPPLPPLSAACGVLGCAGVPGSACTALGCGLGQVGLPVDAGLCGVLGCGPILSGASLGEVLGLLPLCGSAALECDGLLWDDDDDLGGLSLGDCRHRECGFSFLGCGSRRSLCGIPDLGRLSFGLHSGRHTRRSHGD